VLESELGLDIVTKLADIGKRPYSHTLSLVLLALSAKGF
jgi:hypothetical protein